MDNIDLGKRIKEARTRKKLTQEQLDKLHDAFRNINPRVINPGAWYDKK